MTPPDSTASPMTKTTAARDMIIAALRDCQHHQSDAIEIDNTDVDNPLAPYLEADESGVNIPAAETRQNFTAMIEDAGAHVIATTAGEFPHILAATASEYGVESLILPQILLHDVAIQDALKATAIEAHAVAEDPDIWRKEVFSFDAACTDCHAAIAATGSLVMSSSPQQPRLMSLAVPIHFAVVRSSQLYLTFAHCLRARVWDVDNHGDMPTNLFLISGPSRTADIEQTLVRGAHGPRHLVVFLIDETAS